MLRSTPLARRTPLRNKPRSPLALAHQKLWEAFSLMIRQLDYWTCVACGTKAKPWEKDERGGWQSLFRRCAVLGAHPS